MIIISRIIKKIKKIGIFMKKLLIVSLLATLAFAKNPVPFAAIGDDVYSNVEYVKKLADLSEYYADKKKIEKYAMEVLSAKEIGFEVEARNKNVSASEYLKTLRELSKTHKEFLKKVYSSFFSSMKDENSVLFLEMVNSKLLDTKAHKERIMNYYMKHHEEIDPDGVIQYYLDEDNRLAQLLKNSKNLTKKERKAAKIKRIRAKYKAEQEALQNKLEAEVIQKKIDIRSNQKKELHIK